MVLVNIFQQLEFFKQMKMPNLWYYWVHGTRGTNTTSNASTLVGLFSIAIYFVSAGLCNFVTVCRFTVNCILQDFQ